MAIVKKYFTAVDVVDYLSESKAKLVVEFDADYMYFEPDILDGGLRLEIEHDSVTFDEIVEEMAARLGFSIYIT